MKKPPFTVYENLEFKKYAPLNFQNYVANILQFT